MRTHEVIDSITRDVSEVVRYLFTNNEMPSDRDALIEDLSETVYQTIDNSLIYTADVLALWEDAGHPEPFELGMNDTISGSITNAVYEHLRDESDGALYDAADEALTDLRDSILAGEITYSWTEITTDEGQEYLDALDEADDPEDIFDALAAFRAEVEI